MVCFRSGVARCPEMSARCPRNVYVCGQMQTFAYIGGGALPRPRLHTMPADGAADRGAESQQKPRLWGRKSQGKPRCEGCKSQGKPRRGGGKSQEKPIKANESQGVSRMEAQPPHPLPLSPTLGQRPSLGRGEKLTPARARSARRSSRARGCARGACLRRGRASRGRGRSRCARTCRWRRRFPCAPFVAPTAGAGNVSLPA